MLNIGLLTFHFADNYGAVMQAYALQEYLRQQGHESEFIDYQPAHVENGGSFWLPTSKHRIKANIYIAYQKYTRWKSRILGDHGRSESFQKFRDENLIVATQRFKSLEELKSVGLPYSHLICGSDQIWNSSPQFGIDPAYFLDSGERIVLERRSFCRLNCFVERVGNQPVSNRFRWNTFNRLFDNFLLKTRIKEFFNNQRAAFF